MNDSLSPQTPLAARIGLLDENALSGSTITQASTTERQQLIQHTIIHGLLPLALQPDNQQFTDRIRQALMPDQTAFTKNVINHLAAPVIKQSRRPIAWWQLTAFSSATAAGLAILIWIITMPVTLASATRTASATWQQLPNNILANATIVLTSGLAEFDLNGHGQILIEGPAEFTFLAANRARLTRGRISLHVTPAGRGYTIDTPDGQIVDISTHFAVSVDGKGTTEAHVINGAITARANDSSDTILLAQDDAAQVHAGQVKKLTANPGAFYTTLPPVTPTAPPFIRWRLDEGQGNFAKAQTHGFDSANTDLYLRGLRPNHVPTWVSGHQGQALAFSGSGAYAASDFPGIGGTNARTLACWVRMPQDFTAADGFALISWGHYSSTKFGSVWQLALNALPKDGPMGRIRIGTHGGMLVGTSDLRDNQWHHVAIVMYGGIRPNIGTHVLVYLDGQLEPISHRTLRSIDTEISDKNHGVWVGRNITNTNDQISHPQGFLRGQIDDVVIVAAALSQTDIRRIMNGDAIK